MLFLQDHSLGRLTPERNEEENGEIHVYNGVKGDERDHGNALHANDANTILVDLGNAA
jgi:hypothetical protein